MISSVEFAINHSSGSNIWRCTPSINILLSLTKVGRLHILLTNITVLPLQLSTKALSIYVYKRMVDEKIIFGPIRKMNAWRTNVEEASGSPTQYSSRNKLLTFWTLWAIQEINFTSCLAPATFFQWRKRRQTSEQIPGSQVEQSKTTHFIRNCSRQTKEQCGECGRSKT